MLFPTVLRQILLGVAGSGLYEPLWSERILGEWVHATAKLGSLAQLQAEGDAALLRATFPRGTLRARPDIEDRLLLPDMNDRHVLAVAIAGHADCIITFNARDFPRHLLAAEGIERRDPDGFLWLLWSQHPEAVAAVVAQVHNVAEKLAGGAIPLKSFLKRAQLWKLGRAMLA